MATPTAGLAACVGCLILVDDCIACVCLCAVAALDETNYKANYSQIDDQFVTGSLSV